MQFDSTPRSPDVACFHPEHLWIYHFPKSRWPLEKPYTLALPDVRVNVYMALASRMCLDGLSAYCLAGLPELSLICDFAKKFEVSTHVVDSMVRVVRMLKFES